MMYLIVKHAKMDQIKSLQHNLFLIIKNYNNLPLDLGKYHKLNKYWASHAMIHAYHCLFSHKTLSYESFVLYSKSRVIYLSFLKGQNIVFVPKLYISFVFHPWILRSLFFVPEL